MPDANYASNSLLMHFDGADAGTSFTDVINPARVFTVTGDAQTKTDQKKFGTAAFRTTSTGFITAPDNAVWEFGSSPFTVELFVRFNAIGAGLNYFVAHYDNGTNQRSWALVFDQATNNLKMFLSSAGTSGTDVALGSWTPSTGVWYHIAADFDGTTYRTYVDGVVIGSSTTLVSCFNSSAALSIGSALTNGAKNGSFNGWLDELRITKGVARYAGAFTAPSAQFDEEFGGSGRVSAISAEVLHTGAPAARVSLVAAEVLRSVTSVVSTGRNRQVMLGSF